MKPIRKKGALLVSTNPKSASVSVTLAEAQARLDAYSKKTKNEFFCQLTIRPTSDHGTLAGKLKSQPKMKLKTA